MAPQKILLIGYRKDAAAAAFNLDLPVILWDKKPPPTSCAQKFVSFIVHDYSVATDTDQIPATVLQWLEKFSITTVVAATEKAVVVAALVREYFQLPGHTRAIAQACHDKLTMKMIAQQHGIPLTPFQLIEEHTNENNIITQFGLPVVIKQRASSGSRGLIIADTKSVLAAKLKNNWIAEKFISGTEMSVESFVHRGKILFKNITQYYLPKHINIMPATLSSELEQQIYIFNEKIIKAFQIERGITHLEFYVTEHGLLFSEIAIRPPGGYLMQLMQLVYQFNPWEMLLKLEMGEMCEFNQQAQQYAAAWIIHPGAGIVTAIKGWDVVSALPQVYQATRRFAVGDLLHSRQGLGESYAKIVFVAPTYAELIAVLELARKKLQIDLS